MKSGRLDDAKTLNELKKRTLIEKQYGNILLFLFYAVLSLPIEYFCYCCNNGKKQNGNVQDYKRCQVYHQNRKGVYRYNARHDPKVCKQGSIMSYHVYKFEWTFSGDWKKAQFKKYNLGGRVVGIPPKGGYLHPLMKVREEFRQIFLELGYIYILFFPFLIPYLSYLFLSYLPAPPHSNS